MKFKEFLKLGIVLAAYASVACILLAMTYALTKTAKEKQDAIRTEEALRGIFPEIESFEPVTAEGIRSADAEVSVNYAYAVKRKGIVTGVAVSASGKSYSGAATVLVGVGLDNQIAGVKILELNDTPGLGQNAAAATYYVDRKAKLTWYGQFAGKGTDAPFEVKKDVAAITAATISSRALARIIKAAAQSGAAYLSDRAEAAQ
jgi:electron transport complex protein RnfG